MIKIKNKKNGVTLIESLIAITIASGVTVGFIKNQIDENERDFSKTVGLSLNELLEGYDGRIAIDGYDEILWSKKDWTDSEIEDLIKKELQGKDSTCGTGTWNPVGSKKDYKLVSCNLFNKKPYNMEMKASIKNDGIGFVEEFVVDYKFKTFEDFKNNIMNFKQAFSYAQANEVDRKTGVVYYQIINNSNSNEITMKDCLSIEENCLFRTVLNRQGGAEYIRADGLNSMIGDHLTFIESKGDSPMKCIRWKNTARDGSGVWEKELVEECGIGIYKNDPHPVMVDILADTGTFKNILLEKECSIFEYNGLEVIDTGKTSPCGLNNSTGDIFQVVDNISSFDGHINNFYSTKINTKELYVKNIITETITSKYAYIQDELKTDLISSYTSSVPINVTSDMTLKEILRAEKDIYVYGDTYIAKSAIITGGVQAKQNIQTNGSVIADMSIVSTEQLELRKVNVEKGVCTVNGALSRLSNGALLSCVSGFWELAIKDSTPIGTVILWSSRTLPKNWIEMNGQSTLSYPDLRAIVGNNVIDMRGVVARGLDNGRGIDSGRGLGTYQEDTMQKITGSFETRSHRARTNYISGAFKDGGYIGQDDGWDGWVGSQRKLNFDSSLQTRTSNETRMKNVALIYIIKAK